MSIDVFIVAEARGRHASGWRLLHPLPCPQCEGLDSADPDCWLCFGTRKHGQELYVWKNRALPEFLGWPSSWADPTIADNPIVTELRGVSDDASPWWRNYAEPSQSSWLTGDELLDVDWDEPAFVFRGYLSADDFSRFAAGDRDLHPLTADAVTERSAVVVDEGEMRRIVSGGGPALPPDRTHVAWAEWDGPTRLETFPELVAVVLETLAVPSDPEHRERYRSLRDRAEGLESYPRTYGGPPQRWDDDPQRVRFVYQIN